MTDTPETFYAQASLTEAELQTVLDAARALDQIAREHPDAAEEVTKVAQIIRIGAEFAQGCNQRIAEAWSRKGSLLTAAKGGVQ